MLALNCENISLSFGVDTILSGVSFALNEGDKLGIIGVNGAGKSSLFSIITGKYEASGGAFYVAKGRSIGILEQNTINESKKTILDEAYSTFSSLIDDEKRLEELRIIAERSGKDEDARRFIHLQDQFTRNGGYEFRGRCKGILKNLGLGEAFWDMPVSSLSGGQKTRLALTCLLLSDPDILLLDEPTNHLDVESMFWLEGYLKASKKTVLIISHDRYFLDSVVSHVLEIENGKGYLYKGNYTSYVDQKKKNREIEQRHYDNQQKEIKRIEAYIEQQKRWNRERNIIAAESRQKMLDRMEKIDKPDALPDKVRMHFESSGESGNDVLMASRLSKSFPGKLLFKDATFQVKKGDRLFICGENGCGKSTLIKILASKLSPDQGSVCYGANVKVGYYDQENQNLHPSNTVLEEIWNTYPNMTETVLRNTLALFLFKGDDVHKKVSLLSGGEKARLTLSKLMLSKMNLLILDEPTNHLDINSREILEEAISNFQGTVIAVSHDRYFVNKLATRILDFSFNIDKTLYNYDGGYESFIDHKKVQKMSAEGTKIEQMTASKEQFLNAKKDNAEIRKQQRRLKQAKDDILKTENRIEELNIEMSKDDIGFDYVKLTALSEELEMCENKLLELYELVDELEGL